MREATSGLPRSVMTRVGTCPRDSASTPTTTTARAGAANAILEPSHTVSSSVGIASSGMLIMSPTSRDTVMATRMCSAASEPRARLMG